MQLLKTLPAFLLVSMTCTASVETSLGQSRRECIASTTSLVDTAFKNAETDAVICYSGPSTITEKGQSITNVDPNHYHYSGRYKCPGTLIDCFWMKAPNAWKGHADGGDDNIHALLTNRCTYDPSAVSVTCT
ncbi:hypothetical protein EX895_004780 [Sporisorium graminicola]|uniref:DUF7888 domain-containing protein n=1 Tax=Sporisorium graminicola TaxID=280036 RepID=A0A4U7KNC1_9BASI|nr:hypothetical protein EX895_004780 [Sporisorium graminicola]TKY85955.1 hypothetical protein EX895_004780 [Sporisorium graminicola]